jgi:hypothetical protein
MGFMDDVKKTASKAAGKVNDLADEHGDKGKDAIDKAADTVDEKTKGKYTDKVTKGADAAKGVIDKMATDGK